MKVLVLDTIHGGTILAEALLRNGDDVDALDVYRGVGLTPEEAASRQYDLVTSPVHLDPAYPLLNTKTPVISHHEMTRRLAGPLPKTVIEVTGARGKTTVSFAIASLFTTKGVLHTSRGTYVYPDGTFLWKKSITPASVLLAAGGAKTHHAEWLVAEVSAGVTGIGTLGVLTSPDDYPIAAGKKSALAAKLESLAKCTTVLVPKGVPLKAGWHVIDDLVSVEGDVLSWNGGSFRNPLLTLAGYREPLKCAAAAGLLLGLDPGRLAGFAAIEGRMQYYIEDGVPFLDNANSGTTKATTLAAAAYLRNLVPDKEIVLVIGEEHKAVCEGFLDDAIRQTIEDISPVQTIAVSKTGGLNFADARVRALSLAKEHNAAVLLAVKTWR
ncbi:MAG TPA: coenzyme F430 synthase [Methanocorpusculum sp.]|nr:coenzyme F430 synthase [Methanocorpusculum sp.]